ncbi:MAG: arginine--tRNA ligase [Acidobacteria bacterium]|nr:arginine--tRNA ligase [Acidobacteriota bacterium]
MSSLYETLDERFRRAFDAISPNADPVLRPSEHADFQVNGALGLAKALGASPREVAARVLDAIDLSDLARVEVAGPGFINVYTLDSALAERLRALLSDERLGVRRRDSRRVVVDYSAPNVAKEMHVGHLRSTVIGDCLARLHRFVGDEVIARNHVGDWGTPFGMLIEHLVDMGEADAVASLSVGDLDSFYRSARQKFDSDEAFRDRSRTRVVALQAGDPETRRLWRILVDQSVNYFSEVYAALGVELTASDVVGESSYNDELASVVADLDAQGLLVESEGALCVFPPGFTGRDGEPQPLIVRKSDEGFGYAATDLAALRDRVSRLGADEIYYVVGAPQSQHFQMIFAVGRLAGWLPDEVHSEHVAFGSVLGPDRKMFKSRTGDTIKLISLLADATERAREELLRRRPDQADTERETLAGDVARAAIKYADLSTDRLRDYVFDLDRMVSAEGDTGPYLQYAHARIRALFRRAGRDGALELAPDLSDSAERALGLALLGFPDAVGSTLAASQPHRLCGYLFELAQRFSSFYEECPILSASENQRESRLVLADLTARTLAVGLDLLGIAAPDQM